MAGLAMGLEALPEGSTQGGMWGEMYQVTVGLGDVLHHEWEHSQLHCFWILATSLVDLLQ